MKSILSVFLFLLISPAFSQNEKVNYDKAVPEFILFLWADEKVHFSERLSSNKNPLLDQITTFLIELRKKENDILSDKFLKKPSDNTLVAYYLHIKIQWNSFNGPDRPKDKKIVDDCLSKLPKRYELLAFYYKAIFIDVLNKQKSTNWRGRNIDLHNLGLNNDTERTIVFLSAMAHLGGQVTAYASRAENCFRAREYIANMPTFNGKAFYDFELPEFEDFEIEIDKRYPKVSFREIFADADFEIAKESYRRCRDSDK